MKKLEEDIFKYLKKRSWHTLRPGDLAKSVAIEAGELLEIFQWDNPPLDEFKKDKVKLEKIKGELADVLLYCLDLSVSLGLDTEGIIRDKLEKVKKKYPAALMSKAAKSAQPSTDDLYWKIKQAHRAKNK